MNKKYQLIPSNIRVLFRIKALRDFVDVKKGDIGGYVQSEANLSHDGDCWVYDDAKVYGDAEVSGKAMVYDKAKVFGDAEVSDNALVYNRAWVYGNDIVTKPVIFMVLPEHNITMTDNSVSIDCEQHSLEYWLKHYKKIGKNYEYTTDMIEAYKNILYSLTHFI